MATLDGWNAISTLPPDVDTAHLLPDKETKVQRGSIAPLCSGD
jgi:hypothetical protein